MNHDDRNEDTDWGSNRKRPDDDADPVDADFFGVRDKSVTKTYKGKTVSITVQCGFETRRTSPYFDQSLWVALINTTDLDKGIVITSKGHFRELCKQLGVDLSPPAEPEPIIWYAEPEIREMLRRDNFSQEAIDAWAGYLTKHLQAAFEKGRSMNDGDIQLCRKVDAMAKQDSEKLRLAIRALSHVNGTISQLRREAPVTNWPTVQARLQFVTDEIMKACEKIDNVPMPPISTSEPAHPPA